MYSVDVNFFEWLRQRSPWLDPLHVHQIRRQDHAGGVSNQNILSFDCGMREVKECNWRS